MTSLPLPTAWRASRSAAFACASATTLLGGLAMVGWLTPWQGLATLYPGSIPMAPTTALVLLVLGGTVLLESRRHAPLLTTAVSLLVLALGSVRLGRFAAGAPLVFDLLLIGQPDAASGLSIQRVSPLTALGLLAASLTLLLVGLANGRRASGIATGSMAISVSLLGGVVTLGYLFGAPLLYGGTVVPMAFSTGLAVLCLGVALFGLTPRDGVLLRPFTGPSVRARALRAFLPIAPAIVVVEGLLDQIGGLGPAVDAVLTTLVSALVVAAIVVYAARGVGLELERAQTELERSRLDTERLAAIVQSSSEAIYALSLDGKIIAWNASATRLYGYTRAEALGQPARILAPAGAEAELPGILERIVSGEQIDPRDTNRVRKDGSLVLVSSFESPLSDASGQVVGVSVSARDVSQQRHGERALVESEKRLRALVNSDMVGLLVANWVCVVEANDEFLRIVGYSREDLAAGHITWESILLPEFTEVDEAARTETLARGSCTPYRKQLLRKDGTRAWVLVGYATLEREPERSVGFVLDIDAWRQTEDELRSSNARFANVFHSGLVAIAIAEVASGRIVDVNGRFAELLGYRRDEMLGRTVFELGLWVDPADRVRVIASMSGEGAASPVEAPFRRKSGEIRHALVSMEATTLAGTAEPLDIVVLVDITDRKTLEAQLLQAQKMEAVGRLAGGVAHDFNNSLGVIMGYTELLIRHSSEEQRKKLEQILKATLHASSLTRQLLAFSRKQVVEPKVLDLNALVSDLEEMLRRLIGEDIDLAIIPGVDLGQVRADPGQLEQVVINLCVNARDAMPDGGLLRLSTSNAMVDERHLARHEALPLGPYVMLAVSDAGKGIEKENLSKIFEPFFTTKEKGKGTGLGLSMVYGIVKQAGGGIWVYSEVGQGTTFKIYLPRIDEPAGDAALLEAPLPSMGTETILLVEDDDALRGIAREILEEHGYRVSEAANPDQALEVVRHHRGTIDLLLTDVVMPRMNGRALAEALVGAHPALRVLYMSGYTDEIIAHRGVLAPGTLMLTKPFTTLGLLRSVRKALGERGPGENK